jgi:VCBS repeat-containing protein
MRIIFFTLLSVLFASCTVKEEKASQRSKPSQAIDSTPTDPGQGAGPAAPIVAEDVVLSDRNLKLTSSRGLRLIPLVPAKLLAFDFKVEVIDEPEFGRLEFQEEEVGFVRYIPQEFLRGKDTFRYRIANGQFTSNVATVEIDVTENNNPPIAVDDEAIVGEANMVVIDVLDNDSDPDPGDVVLISEIALAPARGTATINETRTRIIYRPEIGFFGRDAFRYSITDGELEATATVVVHVIDVKRPPTIVSEAYTVDQERELVVGVGQGVLANDRDYRARPLTAQLVNSVSAAQGALTFNADGSFRFVPAAGFSGVATFRYAAITLDDMRAESDVNITVNRIFRAPIAVNDTYTVDEDNQLVVPANLGVLANDMERNGSTLTAALVLGVPAAVGSLTLNANGSFTFIPAPNYNGSATFRYAAVGAQNLRTEANVVITVNPVNDPPVAVNDSYTTFEDFELNVDALRGVLANDYDIDGDPLRAVLVTGIQASQGTLMLNENGSFRYVPARDYFGTVTFRYAAVDPGNLSSEAIVTITVIPVNDPPIAVNDSYTVLEDNILTRDAAQGVLANDIDVDTPRLLLTAILVVTTTRGLLTFNADGSFQYVPAPDFFGVDTFRYIVFDGDLHSNVATVTINVTPVNDPPVASNDFYSTDEDVVLNVSAQNGVLRNAIDVDTPREQLRAILVQSVTNGSLTLNTNGSFTYTPTKDFFGSDTFRYKINDGELDSNVAIVTITINPVNDAPIAVNDSYAVDEDFVLTVSAADGVIANDIDVDTPRQQLVAMLVSNVSNGTLIFNSNGSFIYTPKKDFSGLDSFTYRISDGELLSNVATVTITVREINDPPVAQDLQVSTLEDTPILNRALLSGRADPDHTNDQLTVIVTEQVQNGVLVINQQSFDYIPKQDFNGSDSFKYRLRDPEGAESQVATVSITVTPVNDAPVAVDDFYVIKENVMVTFDVLSNDFDVDGDALTITNIVQPPNHGRVMIASNKIVYEPDLGVSNEDDLFVYRISDGTLHAQATVRIRIEKQSYANDQKSFQWIAGQSREIVDVHRQMVSGIEKMIVVSTAIIDEVQRIQVLRLNADGSRDDSYGTNALVTVKDMPALANTVASGIDAAGRLWLGTAAERAGQDQAYQIVVYDSSGVKVETVGVGGVATIELAGTAGLTLESARGIFRHRINGGNNQYLIALGFSQVNDGERLFVYGAVRLNASAVSISGYQGMVDLAKGKLEAALSNNQGELLICYDNNGAKCSVLLSDGSRDFAGFASETDGALRVGARILGKPRSLSVRAGGVASYVIAVEGMNGATQLVSFTRSGFMDTGFNGASPVSLGISAGQSLMAVQSYGGKIVILIKSEEGFIVRQYFSDGEVDGAFGIAGALIRQEEQLIPASVYEDSAGRYSVVSVKAVRGFDEIGDYVYDRRGVMLEIVHSPTP